MHRIELDYQAGSYRAPGQLPKRPQDETRYLSNDQIQHLADILADIPALLEDLEIAITKDVRFPTRTVQGDGSEAAIMFNTSASYAASQLRIVIVGAAVDLWNRLVGRGVRHRLDDPTLAAEWLTGSLDRLALIPDAEQTARNITRAHNRAIRVIDRPADPRYLGDCPHCGTDLYAEHGAQYVTCNNCDWAGETDTVIRNAIKAGLNMLFTDTELIGAVEAEGHTITRNQINSWVRSGRLTPHEQHRWSKEDQKIITRRTYRLKDVLDLAEERKKRARERESHR